jgi:hypothetical protein
MRPLILIALALFLTVEVYGQASTAALYITLTDIQSVKIAEVVTNDENLQKVEVNTGTPVQILSPSGSQVRKFDSNTSDINKFNKEFHSGITRHSSVHFYASNTPDNRAGNSKVQRLESQFIVYQVDPR